MEKIHEKIENCHKTCESYPELVKSFIEIGVRSYTVDVVTGTTLYRFDEGNNFLQSGDVFRKVNDQFDYDTTQLAIQENQQGKTTYPVFMDEIAKAGVRFYEATLTGDSKRVTYIGAGGKYEEPIALEPQP